jgi:magnesium-transporting ATPase (P-type)
MELRPDSINLLVLKTYISRYVSMDIVKTFLISFDCMLQLISSTLRVEQGSLTGETASVNKTSHKIELEDTNI